MERPGAAIELSSDAGGAHEVMVGEVEDGDGDADDGDVFEGPVDGPVGDPDLKADHEGEVGEIDPVGGVGDVAPGAAFFPHVVQEEAQAAEGESPDGEGVTRPEEGAEDF